jgi:hypothetical protein
VYTIHGTKKLLDRVNLPTEPIVEALAVEGPIREYYVVGQRETADEEQWQTEIGWPIFQTG